MEQKFIEMAKTIFSSIDHYRESGRDDKFNIDSIAEYLQRQFLLQQTDCYMTLELLEKMYSEEIKEYDRVVETGFLKQSEHHYNSDCIRQVLKLIKERQANAV